MPVELIVQGIDQASEVLDRVGEKTEHMGGLIAAAGIAAAAVGGFLVAAKGMQEIVGAASEAQDSMSRFDAVYAATSRAAADAADTVLASAGKQVTTGKLSAAAVNTLTDSIAAMSLEVPVATAKLAENTKIVEINSSNNKWSAEAIAVHRAELAKETGALQALNDKLADAKEKLAGAAGTTRALASTAGSAAASTMMERDAMIKLSESLSGVTVFSHEAVLGAEGVLLTFRDIGKDVIPQATEAVLNLSTRMGTDAESAARLLGKALVEPGVGLLRLKAAGVDFTKAQDAMIKKMAESGDVAGAQKVILDALEKSIGGTAKAAGQTLSGELKRAEHAMDDVKEKIGTALLPMLQAGTEAFIGLLGSQQVQDDIEYVTFIMKDLVGVFSGAADSTTNLAADMASLGNQFGLNGGMIEDLVNGFFKLTDALKGGNLSGAGSLLTGGFSNLLPALANLGAQLGTTIRGWGDQLGPPIMALVDSMVEFVRANLPAWIIAFANFEVAVWTWIQNAIPPLLTQLSLLFARMIAWVQSQIAPWTAMVSALAGPLFAWVQAAIPPLLVALGAYANSMFQWVAAQIGPWATALGALVGPAIAWIRAALPGLAANLGTFSGQLLAFVLQLVIDAADAFRPLGLQFISWIITDVLPQLPQALGDIAFAILSFLTNLIIAVSPELLKLGQRFTDWIADVLPRLPAELGKIGAAIQVWNLKVSADLTATFYKLGGDLMNSIGKGITDAVNALVEKLKAALAALEDALRNATNWHSPVPLYVAFGNDIMNGIALGITSGTPAAVNAMTAAVSALSIAPAAGSPFGAGSATASGAHGVAPMTTPTPVQIVAHVYNNLDIEDLAFRVFQAAKAHGA